MSVSRSAMVMDRARESANAARSLLQTMPRGGRVLAGAHAQDESTAWGVTPAVAPPPPAYTSSNPGPRETPASSPHDTPSYPAAVNPALAPGGQFLRSDPMGTPPPGDLLAGHPRAPALTRSYNDVYGGVGAASLEATKQRSRAIIAQLKGEKASWKLAPGAIERQIEESHRLIQAAQALGDGPRRPSRPDSGTVAVPHGDRMTEEGVPPATPPSQPQLSLEPVDSSMHQQAELLQQTAAHDKTPATILVPVTAAPARSAHSIRSNHAEGSTEEQRRQQRRKSWKQDMLAQTLSRPSSPISSAARPAGDDGRVGQLAMHRRSELAAASHVRTGSDHGPAGWEGGGALRSNSAASTQWGPPAASPVQQPRAVSGGTSLGVIPEVRGAEQAGGPSVAGVMATSWSTSSWRPTMPATAPSSDRGAVRSRLGASLSRLASEEAGKMDGQVPQYQRAVDEINISKQRPETDDTNDVAMSSSRSSSASSNKRAETTAQMGEAVAAANLDRTRSDGKKAARGAAWSEQLAALNELGASSTHSKELRRPGRQGARTSSGAAGLAAGLGRHAKATPRATPARY